jgi:hypothetical protein
MGQRANYIIKERDKLTIHYNHWRANSIASDLYLGEKRFLEFINECQLNDEIMNEPWIEGCVIVDRNQKELFFWSFEFSRDTSVVDYYLKQLSKKWENWTLSILKNRMYDVEKLLSIDYISKQELQPINRPLKDDIIADKVEDWVSALVIIKQDLSLFITKTGSLNAESIISYGQDILSLIKNKPKYELPKEGEEGTNECVLIVEDNKKIFINESIIGLVETCKEFWTDYDLIIGDFGYIETLRLGGIETSGLELSDDEIKNQFSEMVQVNDSFNPFEMAEKIKQNNKDVQFNPDFFDNVKPKKPFIDKLKISIKKLWRQK